MTGPQGPARSDAELLAAMQASAREELLFFSKIAANLSVNRMLSKQRFACLPVPSSLRSPVAGYLER